MHLGPAFACAAADDAKVAVDLAITGASRPRLEALLRLIVNDTKTIFPKETVGCWWLPKQVLKRGELLQPGS